MGEIVEWKNGVKTVRYVGNVAPTSPPPPTPVTDPGVLEILRALVHVSVGPDAPPEIAAGLTGLVIDGEGVWQVRQGRTVSEILSLAKVKMPFFPALGYNPGVMIHAPLPVWIVEEVGSFFRWVYNTHKAEAFVRIFWKNADTVGDVDWQVVVPEQIVSAGGVKHDLSAGLEGWIHWGDIHSHGSMDTFWSGVDDADEAKYEGCLFGVMGKWNDLWPKSKWRARLGGKFIDLPLDQVTAGQQITFSGTVSFGKMLDGSGKVELASSAIPFPADAFPEEWKTMVKEQKGYSAAQDYRTRGRGGYDPNDFGWGRGRIANPSTQTDRAGGSTGYRNTLRSPRQAQKLIKRIKGLVSGARNRGRSLFSQDPATARWFVDEQLVVWTKATPTSPLVRVVTSLEDLLMNEINAPRMVYPMTPSQGMIKTLEATSDVK